MLSDTKYIKPSLNEKFEGIIWKIEIDDKFPVIAIESRNSETHTTTFSAYDFQKGECLFKEFTVENSWKWSLDRVNSKMVFIHSYLSEETPEHKSIIAINELGKTAWQHHNKTLHDVAEEGLVAFDPKIQGNWLEILDPPTGTTIKSYTNNYTAVPRDIIIPNFIFDKALVPIHLPDNVVGEVAYIRFNDKDIACYHLDNESSYTQQLLITTSEQVLLIDNLAVDILKRNPEAFFISQNHLFCIRDEKREIVSYLV